MVNENKIEIPEYILEIIEALEAKGFEAYIVGGCVRDALLFRAPQDWDVATSATPDEVKACFSHYHVLEIGVNHGTITVICEGKQVEITTFRVDGAYSDYRRPDKVSFTRNLKSDLARRDFTINALAYNPNHGLVDYFGGTDDLKNSRIMCVGEARERFSEDALRIMRAVRFASTLGFCVESSTCEAMNELGFLLAKISPERIMSELCKTLTGDCAAEVLLNHTQIFTQIIPELSETIGFNQHTKFHCFDVWQHTVEAVKATPQDLILRLSMLLHDCGKPKCFTLDDNGEGHFYGHAGVSAELAGRILSRLRFDNDTKAETVYLIKHHSDSVKPEEKHIKRLLNKMGEERLRRLLKIKRADTAAKAKECCRNREKDIDAAEELLNNIITQKQVFSLSGLAINGNDLLEIGFDKGKIIGDTLNILLELVIDGEIENTQKTLISRAKQLL